MILIVYSFFLKKMDVLVLFFHGLHMGCHMFLPLPRLQATSGAFCALLGDGSLVAWGDPGSGGDSNLGREERQLVFSFCLEEKKRNFDIKNIKKSFKNKKTSKLYILLPPKTLDP